MEPKSNLGKKKKVRGPTTEEIYKQSQERDNEYGSINLKPDNLNMFDH